MNEYGTGKSHDSQRTSRPGDSICKFVMGMFFAAYGGVHALAGNWTEGAALSEARQYHTATPLADGTVLLVGGQGTHGALATTDRFNPTTNTWSPAASLGVARIAHAAAKLANGRVLVTGGWNGSRPLDSVEFFDSITNAWTPGPSLASARNHHTASALPDGRVLVIGGVGNSDNSPPGLEVYLPDRNEWTAGGAMASVRAAHTATLLPNGKVLVVGGFRGASYPADCELYDPATYTWSPAGRLSTGRYGHSATLLPSGKVLVAGGGASTVPGDQRFFKYYSNAELYDPATNSWSDAGQFHVARFFHTATLQPSGRVLIAGGEGVHDQLSAAEIYDPATNAWTSEPSLWSSRMNHTATLLDSGVVLVAGGIDKVRTVYNATSELFSDYAGKRWSRAGNMHAKRSTHTMTLLQNGKVLAVGGESMWDTVDCELFDPATNLWIPAATPNSGYQEHTANALASGQVLVVGGRSAETYDPISNTWVTVGNFDIARYQHTATVLVSGKVLVVGGTSHGPALRSATLFDPVTQNWISAGNLANARYGHTATLLPNGMVHVAGGWGESERLSSVELYDPDTNTWVSGASLRQARSAHSATILPGGRVLVTGGYGETSSEPAVLASSEIYDPQTNTWSDASNLGVARAEAQAALLPNGEVIIYGGRWGADRLSSAERYDVTGDRWTRAGTLIEARGTHAGTLLADGRLLVSGGRGESEDEYTASSELYSWRTEGTIIEFYNEILDHYFITADGNEAAAIDRGSAGQGWRRTGQSFASGGDTAVCRFYGTALGPNSHFYTANASECAFLRSTYDPSARSWKFESYDFLTTPVPTEGVCPSGTSPVYRAYNDGFARGIDSNHRIVGSSAAISEVVGRGWKNEGIAMCAPL